MYKLFALQQNEIDKIELHERKMKFEKKRQKIL